MDKLYIFCALFFVLSVLKQLKGKQIKPLTNDQKRRYMYQIYRQLHRLWIVRCMFYCLILYIIKKVKPKHKNKQKSKRYTIWTNKWI